MSEADGKSALNGLVYKRDYINSVLQELYDNISTRTFAALWRKHVDPDFTKELQLGPSPVDGMTFDRFIREEMIGQQLFAMGLLSEENGMQKFIDFVNDANKKIEEEGKKIELVPLQKAAPAKKAEPAKKTPKKKKARPTLGVAEYSKTESPNEAIAKTKEAIDAILNSGDSFAVKKRKLIALMKRDGKKQNIQDKLLNIVEKAAMAKSELSLRTSVDSFVKATEKQSEIPGETKFVNADIELKKKIREIDIKVRKAKIDVNKQRNEIVKQVVAEMKRLGIPAKSKAHSQILKRLQRLNVNNPTSLLRFSEYVSKVLKDASYAEKLKTAESLRSKIKRGRGKDNVPFEIRHAARAFGFIDPDVIKDIDGYIEMSEKILDAFSKAKVEDGILITPEMFVLSEVNSYIKTAIAAQEETEFKELVQQLESKGLDPEGLTSEQMIGILRGLKEKKESTAEKLPEFLTAVSNYFNSKKADLEAEIKRRETNKKDADMVRRFMAIEPELFKDKSDAIFAVNLLNNFFQNGSTSGMEGVVLSYEGIQNAKKEAKKGRVGVKISTKYGRLYGKLFNQLGMEFERVMGGVPGARDQMVAMGLNEFIVGNGKATREVNDALKEYVKLRIGNILKPKTTGYDNADNTYERGIYAYVSRIDEGFTKEKAFERRKSLVEQSIEREKDRDEMTHKALVTVYDRILKESNSFEEVEAKMDKKNIELVNFWRKKLRGYRPEALEFTEGVLNQTLANDINFFPEAYISIDDKKISESSKFNGKNYDRRASALIEATNPYQLSKNRVINFNFDEVALNKTKELLIDIKTARATRKIEAYMDTEEFVSMMGNKVNVDRIKNAVNSYTEAVRGENDYVKSMNKSEYIGLSKFINTLYSVGAARALVSFTQSFKQTIPVIVGASKQVGRFLFSRHTHGVGMPGSSMNRWINRSGYPIANRGGVSYFEATNEEKVA